MTSSYALCISCRGGACLAFAHSMHVESHKVGEKLLMIDLTPKKNHYGNKVYITPKTSFSKLKVNDMVTYKNLPYKLIYKKRVKDGYLLLLQLQK